MLRKIFFLTTLLVVLFFIPSIASATVIINEITWMGTENSANDEWIELKNISNESIELFGWTLEAADGTPIINLLGNIPANGYFLLERTDDTSVPSIAADQIYTGALGNTGEHLKLKNASNNVVDEINASDGWVAGNNSTKQTMERTTNNWQTSLNPGGTPKAQNSSGAIEEPEEPEEDKAPATFAGSNPPIPDAGDNIIAFIEQEITFDGSNSTDPDGDELAYSWNMGDGKLIEEATFTYRYLYPGTYLVTLMVYDGRYYVSETITVKIQSQEITINEFIPNPSGEDAENEWIEVYNDSDSIVDISGWQLDDEEEGSKPFIFPENTLIAPKSYLVFARPITKIALNNDKDVVRLLLPEGAVFQEVSYEKPQEGMSSARTPEGFVWSPPTPGSPNLINMAIAEGIGGEVFYQQEIKPQTTKQSSQNYSWYYTEIPEQNIEGGYLARRIKTEATIEQTPKDQLAMIPSEAKIAKLTEGENKESLGQSSFNLALLVVAIILGAAVVGLSLVKFRRKFP